MLTLFNQRWRQQRSSYRPSDEVIDTSRYEIASIPDDTTAKRFVLEHHYSASYPAARFRFGLFDPFKLVGVAVFSIPCNEKVITGSLPVSLLEGVELGRFVLLDEVPGNGETWFLRRCFESLRAAGIRGVVSFSDPEPRTSIDGDTVFPGHVGTIYQAHNAIYLGKATPRTLRLLPDGTVFSDRTAQKIRTRERGWEYAVEQLIKFGADEPGDNLRTWLTASLGRVTRPLRHRGNHKYIWTLDRRLRRHLPESEPYPKLRGGVRC
jgi:hypothetical protein